MGVRFPTAASTTVLGSPIVTTAETIIVTTPPATPPLDGAQALLVFNCILTIGATGNLVTFKLYRGATLASPNFGGLAGLTAVAANVALFCFTIVDAPPASAGLQYSVSATIGAATGNTTVNSVSMFLLML